jgi:hypothetical protein
MAALSSKFTVLVLMLSLMATGLSAQSLVVESPRLAGCHSHLLHPASVLSVDHDCCQSGHNSALVKPAVDVTPDPGAESALQPVITLLDIKTCWPETVKFSEDPPVSPPLLI